MGLGRWRRESVGWGEEELGSLRGGHSSATFSPQALIILQYEPSESVSDSESGSGEGDEEGTEAEEEEAYEEQEEDRDDDDERDETVNRRNGEKRKLPIGDRAKRKRPRDGDDDRVGALFVSLVVR